jgi:hypothetical protein
MERLSKEDVRAIIEMIENELSSVPRLDKIQKMKMRVKIRQQQNWLLAYTNPTSDQIFRKLEGRLSDILSFYPYGFSDRLQEMLSLRLKKSSQS